MDPSEPENKMCRTLPLTQISKSIPLGDCQKLWGTYLKPQHLADGHFPATIFWFPLRQTPSKIASTLYTYDKATRLFESFGKEAHLCLIFLKCLENINLKVSAGHNQGPTVVHQVNLDSPDMSEVRKRRTDFRKHLQQCQGIPAQTVTCDYEVNVVSTKGNSTAHQKMHILHYLPGTNKSASSKHLHGNSRMPIVGVAAPLLLNKETAWSNGHIFSFLPLPLETCNNTQLPVYVNGFFALDQNRRHVKWQTEETNKEPDVSINV